MTREVNMMNEQLECSDFSTVEPLLTAGDLQRLLQITRRTITRLCNAGRLPHPIRLGGAWRWKSSEVRRFINNLT